MVEGEGEGCCSWPASEAAAQLRLSQQQTPPAAVYEIHEDSELTTPTSLASPIRSGATAAGVRFHYQCATTTAHRQVSNSRLLLLILSRGKCQSKGDLRPIRAVNRSYGSMHSLGNPIALRKLSLSCPSLRQLSNIGESPPSEKSGRRMSSTAYLESGSRSLAPNTNENKDNSSCNNGVSHNYLTKEANTSIESGEGGSFISTGSNGDTNSYTPIKRPAAVRRKKRVYRFSSAVLLFAMVTAIPAAFLLGFFVKGKVQANDHHMPIIRDNCTTAEPAAVVVAALRSTGEIVKPPIQHIKPTIKEKRNGSGTRRHKTRSTRKRLPLKSIAS